MRDDREERVRLRPGPRRRHDARIEFLAAVRNVTPRALRDLHASVFPLYREAQEMVPWARNRGPTGVALFWAVVRRAREESPLRRLREAFDAWAAPCAVRDAWLLDVARETLDLWARSPASAQALDWQMPHLRFTRPVPADNRRLAIVQVAEYQPDREDPEAFAARMRGAVERDLQGFLAAQRERLAAYRKRLVEDRLRRGHRLEENLRRLRLVREFHGLRHLPLYARYRPAGRVPDAQVRSPATYSHLGLGVTLRSDTWTPVSAAVAAALLEQGIEGIEVTDRPASAVGGPEAAPAANEEEGIAAPTASGAVEDPLTESEDPGGGLPASDWLPSAVKRAEHFAWLARFQFGRESIADIAAAPHPTSGDASGGRPTPQAVSKAVRVLAGLVGLTLRKPLPGVKKGRRSILRPRTSRQPSA